MGEGIGTSGQQQNLNYWSIVVRNQRNMAG